MATPTALNKLPKRYNAEHTIIHFQSLLLTDTKLENYNITLIIMNIVLVSLVLVRNQKELG